MRRFAILVALIYSLVFSLAANAQDSFPKSSTDIIGTGGQLLLIRNVLVPAQEPGILLTLNVKEGDIVQEGQDLAELDRELYELEQASANLRLKVAELKSQDDVDLRFSVKSRAVAEKTFDRSQAAVEQYEKAISKTELERLKLDAERAALSIEKAEFDKTVAEEEASLGRREVEAADLKLKHRTITSPISGMVIEVFPEENEWVRSGEPLVRIVQLDKLKGSGNFPATEIDDSFVGKKAFFESDISREEFVGTITFVSPEILPSDRVKVWFEIENSESKLRPGEQGSVRIPIDQ